MVQGTFNRYTGNSLRSSAKCSIPLIKPYDQYQMSRWARLEEVTRVVQEVTVVLMSLP